MSDFDTEEKGALGEFIRRRYHEFALRYPGKFNSLAEFGQWIDPTIKQSTFSTWCNNQKVPTGKNVTILAKKLGPEVYAILGVEPKLMHPKVGLIDLVWDLLPSDLQHEWLQKAEEVKQQREDDPLHRGKRTTG